VQDPEDKEMLESALSSLEKSKPNKKALSVTVKGLAAAAENIKNISMPGHWCINQKVGAIRLMGVKSYATL
jgi:hypothetical protein